MALRRTGITRKTPLAPGKALPRRSRLASGKPAKRNPRHTGPSTAVLKAVVGRSGPMCEWPACRREATDSHHRLNRKAGGRHGEMHERINQAAWILRACRPHHQFVTSPSGERREQVIEMGWLLLEGQDALLIPVITRHWPGPIWLNNDGGWTTKPPTAESEDTP